MLERMVDRLGHKAIVSHTPTPAQLRSVDVMLLEPAAEGGARLARTARAANPPLPIICASVAAPPVELAALGNGFAGALVKPFTAAQLDAEIRRALTEAGSNRPPEKEEDARRAA
jgi:DNA-binding response OmpR family regulator